MNEVNFEEVNFNVEKIDGGFIVQTSNYTGGSRKIVRKLSEVVALLKAAMVDEVTQ
jgi:hypothetical protein